MSRHSLSAGRPTPLGATVVGDGVNFAVFSAHAEQVFLCLFDETGQETKIPLPEREGDVWYGHVAGVTAGQAYGFRAEGPYRPDEGHRFNANKLLLDPYARCIRGEIKWHDAVFGFEVGHADGDLSFDTRDSAPYVPRSVVCDLAVRGSKSPNTALSETIIYEAHVRGLTCGHPDLKTRGTFESLTEAPVLDHLTALGVTTIELLPVQTFVNDRFLIDKGLTNYWGYQTIGFFAPDPRYLAQGHVDEFRQMVDRFHDAGLDVVLDVVYNHSGETDHLGPTLAFRGLDNASYYRLADERRYYINDAGTGNTFNLDHPMVMRMVLDSLRYWVQVMGVDGFRFDLCSVLGRTADGFDPGAAFFDALRQDPVLAGVKLIAEPWDIGPGGYQLGGFPVPFAEWNDQFRDDVRRYWRGDAGMVPALAARLTGSAAQFDHSGRQATSSVNLLTAHDGFTLTDTVSYVERHNLANGEDGRDGHGENFSDNLGVEGPTQDAQILSGRAARRRAMMATLLLSQGTPMVLSGDELGHSQGGNNNAYNQDNATTWIDWELIDHAFLAFTQRLIAFRKAHPILRQTRFLHAQERAADGKADLFWWRRDGGAMTARDWEDGENRFLMAELRTAAGTPDYAESERAILLIFNAGAATEATLPPAPCGYGWKCEIDTACPDAPDKVVSAPSLHVHEQTVVALTTGPLTTP